MKLGALKGRLLRGEAAVLISLALLSGPVQAHWLDRCIEAFRRAHDPLSKEFVEDELHKLEDYWRDRFGRLGWPFFDIKSVIYEESAHSACGPIDYKFGPLYCRNDNTIYFSPRFFTDLQVVMGGRPSRTLIRMSLAHEVAHHVQQLRGAWEKAPRVIALKQLPFVIGARELTSRIEFQADCLTGVYFRSLHSTSRLTAPEVVESLTRLAVLGDDAQSALAGRMTMDLSELKSHGTSLERLGWYMVGLNSNDILRCETFGAPVLFGNGIH